MEIPPANGLIGVPSSEHGQTAPETCGPNAQSVHLRLLATSDLHVHILPFDYYSGTPTDRLGLARTASLIAEARAEVQNSLLFDNGDFLQGSPLGDYIAQSRGLQPGDVHPIFAAMNALRYDAGTLGNHEFNYGLGFLTEALAGAAFPIVAANVQLVDESKDGRVLVPPYVILNRIVSGARGAHFPIKIGVIGFTPPQIMVWDRSHLEGKLTTKDMVAAANVFVPMMKADGADLIIALSHSGIGPAQAAPDMENASTALANIVGIDAVIAGHSHLVFPSDDFVATADIDPVQGTLCGKPGVMPGFYGSHLGVVDLWLSCDQGRFTVQSHKTAIRPIWQRAASDTGTALTQTHAEVAKIAANIHQETLIWASKPIGHTKLPLHSFFALLAEAPALQLVANAQTAHVAQKLATTAYCDLPILTSVAPFKAGGRGGPENYTDILAGDVLLRHAADLYMHPNTAAAIRMTGAEIEIWLEYAAGIFNQIAPGSADTPLINPDFPSFNFDIIYGLDFQIDLSQPPRFDPNGGTIHPENKRVIGLKYQGAPLDRSEYFVVATNSYRISAKSSFLPALENRILFQTTENIRDVVVRHFASGQAYSANPAAAAKNQHRFAAMPGTTAVFDTSPKARSHLASLHPMNIEPIGMLQSGFMRFRLHL